MTAERDSFLAGVVQGGSLAHCVAAPVVFAFAVIYGDWLIAALAVVMLLVGVYVREQSREW